MGCRGTIPSILPTITGVSLFRIPSREREGAPRATSSLPSNRSNTVSPGEWNLRISEVGDKVMRLAREIVLNRMGLSSKFGSLTREGGRSTYFTLHEDNARVKLIIGPSFPSPSLHTQYLSVRERDPGISIHLSCVSIW